MFRLYKERLQFFDAKNMAESWGNLRTLKTLLTYVEEMSTLGGQGSINQGLKTNVRDFFNFSRRIESFINRRLNDNKKTKVEIISDLNKTFDTEFNDKSKAVFDMNLFLKNDVYAQY